MAQAKNVQPYNTFIAGLITEATELTFPPNASSDELNTVLFPKGNRQRRKGLDYEPSYVKSSFSMTSTDIAASAITTHEWKSAGEYGQTNFTVIQVGSYLYFFNDAHSPLSGGEKSFSVNLNSYLGTGNVTAAYSVSAAASGRGDLFVVTEATDPIRIAYNQDADTLTVNRITIQIRDFEGVDDALAVDEQPTTLSDLHKYNLYNQGWYITADGVDNVSRYHTTIGKYPSNNMQWTMFKWPPTASSTDRGNVDSKMLARASIGSTWAPKGHYILDAFYKDRAAASAIASVAVESSTRKTKRRRATTTTVAAAAPTPIAVTSSSKRPVTVAFFAGRVAYAADDAIFVSEVLNDSRNNAGKCYQDADPTSEDISDLVDSDGLMIRIPEADEITNLIPFGSGLLVLATNGVWAIVADDGFKATNFGVRKISAHGCIAPQSVVQLTEGVLYWAEAGIVIVSQESVSQLPSATVFTDQTIKSFYLNIASSAKSHAHGIYDSGQNIIYWLYHDGADTLSLRHYNAILVFNVTLKAFVPWSIAELTDESIYPFVCGAVRTPTLNYQTTTVDVANSSGTLVVDSSDVQVVSNEVTTVDTSTFVRFLVATPYGGSAYKFTFADFTNTSFTDFEKYATIEALLDQGALYDSYLETGFELQGDLVRQKQAPYIITHFKRTETGYDVDTEEFVLPSSCFIRAKWEWSDNASSGRWSRREQIYRIRQATLPSVTDLSWEPGNAVVTSRSRIRGHGRALQLRFESEDGKDFDILGWGVVFTGNSEP